MADDKTQLRLWSIDQYQARGWAVVPLHWVDDAGRCSCGSGEPDHHLRQGGKHPLWRKWPEHLVRDAATAASIWAEGGTAPAANIGIATGAPSGIWVLDVDPDNGGGVALAQLLGAFGAIPPTYTVTTGSGGTHFYFAMPLDFEPTNRRGALPPGIDVRGTGGQVVVPPSRSAKGDYIEAHWSAIAPAPEWLLDLIRPLPEPERPALPPGGMSAVLQQHGDRLARYAATAVARNCEELAEAPEGQRNHTAFRVACRLHELINAPWARLSVNDVERVYGEAAAAAGARGSDFPWTEARAAWDSARHRIGDRAAELPEDRLLPGGAVMTPPPFYPAAYVDPTRAADPLTSSGIGIIPPIREMFVMPSTVLTPGPGWNGAPTGECSWTGTVPPAYGGPPALEAADFAAQSAGQAAPEIAMAEPPEWQKMISRMLTADQLELMPPPKPLINGLLDLDSLAWLIGPPGTYKSFLALDWAAHVAQGAEWFGYRVTQGPVVYVVAEGARGMALRAAAWRRHHGREIGTHLRFLPEPVQAVSATGWQVLVDACAALRPALVILDTQSRISVGLDENDNSQMMQFVAAADAIRRVTGACVLTVHHSGRGGKDARGASSIDGAQDAELRLERPNKHGLDVLLHMDKQKDQVMGEPLTIELIRVMGEPAFDPVTHRDLSSLAIKSVDRGPMVADQAAVEAEAMDATALLAQVFRDTFAAGDGGTEAQIKGVFRERREMDKATVSRAWSRCRDRDIFRPIAGKARFIWWPDHLRQPEVPWMDREPWSGSPDEWVNGG